MDAGPRRGDDALWFFGTFAQVLAEGEGYAVVEQLVPPGLATPLHVQPGDDETFHVLGGEVAFTTGDETHPAAIGRTVHVPRGTPHGWRVLSEGARMLVVTTPRHLAFFRAAGDPAPEPTLPPPGEPDLARVADAAERYGVEILGPLP